MNVPPLNAPHSTPVTLALWEAVGVGGTAYYDFDEQSIRHVGRDRYPLYAVTKEMRARVDAAAASARQLLADETATGPAVIHAIEQARGGVRWLEKAAADFRALLGTSTLAARDSVHVRAAVGAPPRKEPDIEVAWRLLEQYGTPALEDVRATLTSYVDHLQARGEDIELGYDTFEATAHRRT